MFTKALSYCATLDFWKVNVYVLIAAIVIEGVTVALRFGLRLESTRDTASSIGTLTLACAFTTATSACFLLPLRWCFPFGIRHALWIIAIGLIVSDAMHRLLVLWSSPVCRSSISCIRSTRTGAANEPSSVGASFELCHRLL